MRAAVLSSWIYTGFCTFVWLLIAFLVAFPVQLMNFHFADLRNDFFDLGGMERLFIPILVAVDIAIDWVLGHRRLSERAGLASFLCLIVYGIFAGIFPVYHAENSPKVLDWLFVGVLACLAIPRFFSFLQTPTFQRVPSS